MRLVHIRAVSVAEVGVWVVPKEGRRPVAAMPNKVLLGGGNGLGGEVMAVHAPIYSKCSNVRGGETPRLWLSAGGEMAPDEGLGGQALDLTPHGVRRPRIASGYAVGT